MRKIIHIDMDAFYASIEQRDNPEFRGKALVVGYSGERGVVAAASYEARRYGIHSAMPSRTALKRYPGLIFVPGRFDVYRAVSRQIMNIFLDYTNKVEPLSLDEAYLDVTTNTKNIPSATLIAEEIRARIRETTGLTASAGVSVNKFLAKIASDYRKPDGIYVVPPAKIDSFIDQLRIEKFYGIGKVTAEKMHRMGIYTGRDLKQFSKDQLIRSFGKAGGYYYHAARGEDDREVQPDRIRKSVGAENTFLEDLTDEKRLVAELSQIAEKVWSRLAKKEFNGRTLTLKVKYFDFEQTTHSKTYSTFISQYAPFWEAAQTLFAEVDRKKPIRLLGLSVSNNREFELPKVVQLQFDFDSSSQSLNHANDLK